MFGVFCFEGGRKLLPFFYEQMLRIRTHILLLFYYYFIFIFYIRGKKVNIMHNSLILNEKLSIKST